MGVDVTLETKARSSPQLKNATDTIMLNSVRKVGELLLYRTYCCSLKRICFIIISVISYDDYDDRIWAQENNYFRVTYKNPDSQSHHDLVGGRKP
jgi:hypothetical protein